MKILKNILFLFLLIPLSSFSQTAYTNYVYEENFDGKNAWPKGSNEKRELKIYNGRYYFEHKRTIDSWQVSTSSFTLDTSKDFEIETSIQKISGVQDSPISFKYDYKDANNYKEFAIAATGFYRVAESVNGTYSLIKAWTKSDKVKSGNYGVNKLKIAKKASTVSFYVNGSFVHSIPYKAFLGKKIAFALYKNQKISIDYIRVKSSSNYQPTNDKKGKSIFYDSFLNNNNSWSTKNDEFVNFEINNGKYYFDYKKDAGYSTTQLVAIDRSRDFKIETTIQKISGVQNYGYGLIFGRSDSNNQNLFQISASGSYKITNYNSGTLNTNKSWTTSTAVKTGNYANNKLSIQKIGSKYEFYINDVKVHTDYNIKLFGDRQGYIVYNTQKIAIDNLNISYIDQHKNNSINNSNVVLAEDFNNNTNNWTDSENENYRFKIENGTFRLNHKRNTSGYITSIDKYINNSKNFEIETKIKKVNGVNNYPFGLLWGGNNENDFRFYISSSGYYTLVRIVDNKEQVIKKWTKSTTINKNNGDSNILKIKKEGNSYSFYINNTYVDKTDFENFYGNQIGFVVYNRQEISVDYLKVNYLKKSKINSNKKLTIPLRENFYTNKNNWFEGNNDKYASSITNNQLVIHRKLKGGIFINKEIKLNDENDFVIETSITDKNINSDGYYGFTFGRKNDANEFSFLLSKNGSYKYRKFHNNNYTEIIKNTASSAIHTYANAKNIIKIEKAGNLLRFYINGKYVNEAPFQSFFGDNFGYTVYHNKKIGVNYLDIKYRADSFNNPPEIIITSPNVAETRGFKIVKANTIEVKGIATDNDGIYQITINGVEAYVTGSGNFTANVPLKYGDNTLIIKATDLKQATSIKKFVVIRKSLEKKNPIVNEDRLITGKYHALIIGVGDYLDNSLDLDKDPSKGSPTEDAENLYKVLTTKYNFDTSNVIYLKNPTEKEINRNFIQLRSKVGNNDSVLIFYAGHGYYDTETERGYWMPSDFEKQYEENVVLNTDIVNHIAKIPSKHTLLISDSCFSGSIFNSSSRGFTKTEKRIQRIFELKSRKAMTSGTLKTVPNKSMFFKYLLKNLDENEDKYLTSRKLFDRLVEPVMDLTTNTPQSGTVYNTGHKGGDFIFIKRN